MWRTTLGSVLLVLALLPLAAPADSSNQVDIEKRLTPAQRHATGLDKLTPEELRLLNQLLREGAVSGAAPASQPATAGGDSDAMSPSRNQVGLQEGPIKARLKGRVEGWQPGTVFELDNGQRWQVLKGEMTLRKPLDAPEILVVPGIVGRWFLQVDEDLPKARVFRID